MTHNLFTDVRVTPGSILLTLNTTIDDTQRRSAGLFLGEVLRITGRLDQDRQEAAIAKLAEVILPDPLAPARGQIALDNLTLRDRLVAETRPFTSTEVATNAGSKGANPYATAARWKSSGDIFSVQHRSVELFPAFQFRDGRPHPSMRGVLAALPQALSPWQRAFWFVSTNGWLGDRAPLEALDEADVVIAAAQREALEVYG